MYPTISADAALQVWSQGHSELPPNPPDAAKQRVWDSVKVKASYRFILESASTEQYKDHLLAVACPESGAWLMAAPISALGLRMDDEVIQVAAGLCLGLPLCRPHTRASCKVEVDELDIHGLSCRFSKGCHSRHASFNKVIKRALETAKIPCHLEPSGLYRNDGKRPDGVSMVPWRGGKVLVWDTTCADSLAPSYTTLAAREARAVAANAEQRKHSKYSHLDATHHFVPIATETLGAIGDEGRAFFMELGRRIKATTQEPQSHQYVLQRVSVAIQRGNAVAVLGSMGRGEDWVISTDD